MKKQRTRTIGDKTKTTVESERPLTESCIMAPMISNSPLLETPWPRAMPPMARKTIVHANCSKSSYLQDQQMRNCLDHELTLFKTPVPKKAMMGMIAITPMSPTTFSIACSMHHKAIVIKHTIVTQYCFSVNASLVGRIALISISPSPSGDRAGR